MSIYAWKLFEVANLHLPRTLVHGMPQENGTRSRTLKLDTWMKAEPGTPGFNLFPTMEAAVKYLPRFRVRAQDLVLARVLVKGVSKKPNSNYCYAQNLKIDANDWINSYYGSEVL